MIIKKLLDLLKTLKISYDLISQFNVPIDNYEKPSTNENLCSYFENYSLHLSLEGCVPFKFKDLLKGVKCPYYSIFSKIPLDYGLYDKPHGLVYAIGQKPVFGDRNKCFFCNNPNTYNHMWTNKFWSLSYSYSDGRKSEYYSGFASRAFGLVVPERITHNYHEAYWLNSMSLNSVLDYIVRVPFSWVQPIYSYGGEGCETKVVVFPNDIYPLPNTCKYFLKTLEGLRIDFSLDSRYMLVFNNNVVFNKNNDKYRLFNRDIFKKLLLNYIENFVPEKYTELSKYLYPYLIDQDFDLLFLDDIKSEQNVLWLLIGCVKGMNTSFVEIPFMQINNVYCNFLYEVLYKPDDLTTVDYAKKVIKNNFPLHIPIEINTPYSLEPLTLPAYFSMKEHYDKYPADFNTIDKNTGVIVQTDKGDLFAFDAFSELHYKKQNNKSNYIGYKWGIYKNFEYSKERIINKLVELDVFEGFELVNYFNEEV